MKGTSAPSATASPSTAPQVHYHKGQAVMIEWRGRWWPGHIRKVSGRDRYLGHYAGYAASWDETVGPSRLKAR